MRHPLASFGIIWNLTSSPGSYSIIGKHAHAAHAVLCKYGRRSPSVQPRLFLLFRKDVRKELDQDLGIVRAAWGRRSKILNHFQIRLKDVLFSEIFGAGCPSRADYTSERNCFLGSSSGLPPLSSCALGIFSLRRVYPSQS